MSATETKTSNHMLEQVFQNIRQAAEANLKLQQEAVRQWSSFWPVAAPQTAWTDSVREFQKKWTSTISEMAKKHREVVDKQYKTAIESLETALNISESTTPEEYRRRSEEFCRKTLDCMRELSETQVREFQDAVTKWTELVTKSAT
jgi:hypothetical protein